jgi:hypothetical protein
MTEGGDFPLIEGANGLVPVTEYYAPLTGSPSVGTLKHDTEGPTMKVRIIRACGDWLEGDEPEVNADYGKHLIENGLAEEVGAKRASQAKRK